MKIATFIGALEFASCAAFAEPTWIGASGNWSDPANWQGGVLPVAGDTVRVSNMVANITINIDVDDLSVGEIHFEGHAAAGDVTVTGKPLTLTSSNWNFPQYASESNQRDFSRTRTAIVAYPYGVIFRCPITFTSSGNVGIVGSGRDIAFYKKVSAPNATKVYVHGGIYKDPCGYIPGTSEIPKNTYFYDDFTAPKANFTPNQTPTGNIYCRYGSFIVKDVNMDDWQGCALNLDTTNTVISSGKIAISYKAGFESTTEGGFPANAVLSHKKNTSATEDWSAAFNLRNIDRTIDRIESPALGLAAGKLACSIRSSNASKATYSIRPTTLTLRGTQSASTEAMVRDEVTVVWDPVENFTQTFSNRVHTTTGSFVVKGGTMRLCGAASMSAARALVVRSGATFELDSTLENPLPRDLIVSIGSHIKLNGKAVTVKRLIVDGVPQADDTYTSATWLDGEGSVKVAAGDCCTWIGDATTGSGNWGDSGNWLGNAVPNSSSKTAIIDRETEDALTVTMGADIAKANFPGRLEISNGGTGTTTLKVTASVEAEGSAFRLGAHAKVEVPEGGRFFYESTTEMKNTYKSSSSQASQAPCMVSLADGAEWKVSGGETVFTNFVGQFWVAGCESVTSRVTVMGGRLLHSGWASFAPIRVGYGALIDVSAGEFYQPHEGNNSEPDLLLSGGKVDLHGTGEYKASVSTVGPGSSGSNHYRGTMLGYGEFIVRDTAWAKFADPTYLRTDVGGHTLKVTYRDSAYMSILKYELGSVDGSLSIADIYDTPSLTGSQAYLGCADGWFVGSGKHGGHGRLTLHEGGFLRLGVNGLFVGSTKELVNDPPASEGFVRIEPASALFVNGSNNPGYDAGKAPNGIRVGGGGPTKQTSGRTHVGRLETAGFVTNQNNLVVGGAFGRGVLVQEDGIIRTATLSYDRAVTVVGMGGGEGDLIVSNGLFSTDWQMWVGGCYTNDINISEGDHINRYAANGFPVNDHSSFGRFTLVDGTLDLKKDLYVGANGTGVVSVVGSKGTFTVGQSLVLSNQSASVVRFLADADGVAPIQVKGRLAITDAAELQVDMSAYTGTRAVKLFGCADIDGEFGAEKVTVIPTGFSVKRRSDGLYARRDCGLILLFR